MAPGSVFFDAEFEFDDGATGRRFFIVLGTVGAISVVAKTTPQRHDRGWNRGCQPNDRFHNYFIEAGTCFFDRSTWVCLDEFYDLVTLDMLRKRFEGKVKLACDLDHAVPRGIQHCALASLDISDSQAASL